MKNLPIRLKIAVLYMNMAIFTIPTLVFSYLFMVRLNQLSPGEGGEILTLFALGYPILLLIYVAVTLFLGRRLTKAVVFPIQRLTKISDALSKGDSNVDLDFDSNDEVGALYRNFRNVVSGIEQQSAVLHSISNGDYTAQISLRSNRDVINQSILDILDKNNDLLARIRDAATQTAAGSTQIADGAQALSQGATEQASAVEQLSASISNVLFQTQANSQSSNAALDCVNQAGRLMKETVEYMSQMEQAMSGITTSSEEISKIIKVIDDIAFQTNILALNAAVEAARAGQHGKGFAVVADEVRNLASKSAQAAKETAALIQKSLEHVGCGSDIVGKTGKSIQAVAESAQKTQVLIVEISAASHQQEDAIRQINTGIDQVSQVVQTNSATAEQSAASSQELSAQAQMLGNSVSRFRLKNSGMSLPALDLDSILQKDQGPDGSSPLRKNNSKYF